MMGLFGLALASVGIAGVTAYSVAKRGHEIGIRMALGAQRRDVLAVVMKEGAALAVGDPGNRVVAGSRRAAGDLGRGEVEVGGDAGTRGAGVGVGEVGVVWG